MTVPAPEATARRLNRLRYLRIVFYFGGLTTRLLWWYGVVQPLLGRGVVRMGEGQRLRRWARQFRDLAVRMGGVMIKLGQFVSSRVDILPHEITDELAGLQDEVPALPFEQMALTLWQELGPTWRERFDWVDEMPVAAASLGQAHRARLRGGERVVIKVQRPGIETLVYTDLSALDVVARFAMRFGFIRRRANVPLLLEEFARVLWEELDYLHEADNADRFAELFADDMGVYIPAVYREHTTRRILVLEDVTAIKLNDYAGIEAVGIDRCVVAQRLLDAYLKQIFVFRFFHADPHPGNIFIYPLPEAEENPRQRRSAQRPFYLIFVDFGMTGELTPELVAGLRETLIAVITRDVQRLVRSYQQLGVLLPGADLQRIEEASQAVFDQVWGLNMSQLREVDYQVVRNVARDFGDLLYTLPFQVPQEFVYLARAVGILSGMCTGLDPTFDPWKAMQPFVRRLLVEDDGQAQRSWLDLLGQGSLRDLVTPETVELALETGRDVLARAVTLPIKMDDALSRLQEGRVELRVRPDERFERHLRRIERTGAHIVAALVFASLTLSSALLYVSGERVLGLAGFAFSWLLLLFLLLRG